MKWLKGVALALVAGTLGACAPTIYSSPPPPHVYRYGNSYSSRGCVWVPAHHRWYRGWVPGHWKC